jgi:hypothetical protein
VVAGLAISIVRDFLAGRLGVDAIALVSMSVALALRQPLAGAVVALMYSAGNVLEEIAVARAERDLRSLVDRAPREAHRRIGDRIQKMPISDVAVGDQLLVRVGEIVPVDGIVTSSAATIDESALTGEPIPVVKARAAAVCSGSLNAGETFELTVSIRMMREAGVAAWSWSPATVPPPRKRSAPRSTLTRYLPTACPPTKSMPFVPSSGSIQPSWSVTESTTRRRWRRPMSALRLVPAAPAPRRKRPSGDPRRPPRSGRRGDRDRATGAANCSRKHRRGDGPFSARDAGRRAWLADAGASSIVQEVIDVTVILSALRALTPAYSYAARHMTAAAGRELHRNHVSLIGNLDRLRSIVDTLDNATSQAVRH